MVQSHGEQDLRLVFFISSYQSSGLLPRLIRTLRISEPSAHIVVHHDSSKSSLDTSEFDDDYHVHVLMAFAPIEWGDLSLDVARWRVFHWIMNNLDFDWVVLLSEQDYPIKPLNALRATLSTEGIDAYVEGQPIHEMTAGDLRHNCEFRYLYRYAPLPSLSIARHIPVRWKSIGNRYWEIVAARMNYMQEYVHLSLRPSELQLPAWIGLRARSTPFENTFPCWYHDPWYSISRKAVEHLLTFVGSHPEVVRYYEQTVIPLESVSGTILFNDTELNIENRSFHETRWSNAASGRPDVFVLDDLEYLLSSSAFFARKFALMDSELLLEELDMIVLPTLSP